MSKDTRSYSAKLLEEIRDAGPGGENSGGGDASAFNQVAGNTRIGAVDETAPESDTASSGLNGRMQRVAQRLATLITTVATEGTLGLLRATVDAINAKLPATVGQKASAASFSVVLTSDQPAIAVTGGSGGTQYTEGDTDPTITGTPFMWEDASDTLRAVSATNPLPVNGSGVTQPISAAALPLPSGAATQVTLASVLAELQAVTLRLAAMTDPADTQPVSGTVTANMGTIAGIATETTLAATNTLVGSVTETAPASDTASSGTNGRLQRVAQRLTSLIALLPASLGQKSMASSLPVVVASDQGALSVSSITLATAANQTTFNTRIGDVTETAPATDTASSGLNGRLQRVAQHLTTIFGRLPAALGQGTMAQSLSVVVSSNQSVIPVGGSVAAGATDSGNPAKIGGVYNATLPTLTTGQRGNAQLTARGELITALQDLVSVSANVTAVDAGSTSSAGANGQSIFTGTPTAGSTAAIAGTGESSFAVQIGGTWVGTLQFERSLDGGTTWTAVGAFSAGTNYITQTSTTNGNFHGNASSATNIRVRATAWTSGTAAVVFILGAGTGTITVGNPMRLWDQTSGVQASIKAASTAAAAADTSLVVALSPNSNAIAGPAAHDAAASGNPLLMGGYASAAAPTSVSADGDVTRAWMLPDGRLVVGNLSTQPLITRSNALAPGVTNLTVTSGAYAALDVFGGLVTLDAVFPAAGNATGGGRTFTITEVMVKTGNSFPLYFVACTRAPATTTADNGAFVFEPSRQMSPRPLTTPVQVDASSWTCYLEQPITIVQSLSETTDDLFLYLVTQGATSHTGTTANVRIAGYLD